jgi:hypothetical protein
MAVMATDPISPARILQTGMGFFASKTLLSAVELGVFTALGEAPLDAEALRVRLGLHPRAMRDFLDALVALGMLERGPDGRYANTAETGLYLDRARETYIGGLLEMMNQRLYGFWGGLTEALRTGQPQNEAKTTGGDPFAALYADRDRLEQFLRSMTGVSLLAARAIAAHFPWKDFKSVVDVGTAQGCLPVQLARTHPHLACIGFDLPPVRPVFERYVAEHGLTDRVRFEPGSFFDDALPAADVVVMGHILHDWDLPTKRMLLGKAHAALPAGGAVLVYDLVIDDERRRNAAGLLMSLNMLIETPGGFDYTGADCIAWMREAGFAEARVESLPGDHAMVIGIK